MKPKVNYWFELFKTAIRLWLDAQAFSQAAALAFFTIFSMAPIMIVAVTIVGLVFGENAAQGQLAQQLESIVGPNAALTVQTVVENSRIENSGILPTLAGIGGLLIGATMVFGQMQTSLNAIWGVAPRPSRNSLYIY